MGSFSSTFWYPYGSKFLAWSAHPNPLPEEDTPTPRICIWINCSVNNREAGDLRRYRAHYDVIVMIKTLVRVMAYCLVAQWHNQNQRWPNAYLAIGSICQRNLKKKYKNLHTRECIWKCCLQDGTHFVQSRKCLLCYVCKTIQTIYIDTLFIESSIIFPSVMIWHLALDSSGPFY